MPELLALSGRAGTPCGVFARRMPGHDTAGFQMGTKLAVADDEAAVFVVDQQALDAMGPGRHLLSSKTLPVLTRRLGLPYGAETTFEAALYLVRTDLQESLRWGTRFPVAFRDNMFGVIRIQGHGQLAARVVNPPLFVNTIVRAAIAGAGPDPDAVLRDLIASRLADFLSEKVDTLIDLSRYVGNAADVMGARLATDFEARGLHLHSFSLGGIGVAPEAMAMLEERGSVAAVGNLCEFLRGQTRANLGVASHPVPVVDEPGAGACGPGGGWSAHIPDDARRSHGPDSPAWADTGLGVSSRLTRCGRCYGLNPISGRYCGACGESLHVCQPCLSCGVEVPIESTTCLRCGHVPGVGGPCQSCGTDIPSGSRFCMACGEPTRGKGGADHG